MPCRKLSHPVPGSTIPLTAPRKRATPEIDNIVPEGSEASTVGRYRVICEVPTDDLSQPLTLVHRTKGELSQMPPLLLELWREQHPEGHEQTALHFRRTGVAG
jgi:hypothetical protein